MIGIIMLIFIGKYYYELANKYDRKGWLFVLIGIGIYYASAFLFGIILGIVDLMLGTMIIEGTSEMVLGLLGIPAGLLVCWIVYKQLEKSWAKTYAPKNTTEEQIQNFGSKDEDTNFER